MTPQQPWVVLIASIIIKIVEFQNFGETELFGFRIEIQFFIKLQF
jgi:hypothetical protein